MRLIRNLSNVTPDLHGSCLSIGNFDGVHQGHAAIIKRIKFWSQSVRGPAIVFTFDPHPVRLLRPELAPPPLTWTERKAELLAELGIDALIAYPTNTRMLELSYREFFEQIICDRIRAAAMVEGPNFYFGHNREGDVHKLLKLCDEHRVACEIVQPQTSGQELISSTRIRNLVNEGDVRNAGQMLTQLYRIRGMVVHGAGRGTEIGFPTANLDAIDTLIPKMGVYAGWAHLNEKSFPAAIHIGPSPTFGEALPKVEVHVIGFQAAIYGQIMKVDFVDRLRDIKQFDSAHKLKKQLAQDVATTKTTVGKYVTDQEKTSNK